MSGDLTSGDPLGDEPPRSEEPVQRRSGRPPTAPAPGPEVVPSGYGGGRVPPGAFAPRPRPGTVDPWASAQPAEWWRRVVAMAIDSIVVGVVATVVIGILGLIVFGAFALDSPGGIAGALAIGVFVIIAISLAALLYAPLVMSATNGKTLGKMATGCRVVRSDGRDVDFLWAAYREAVIKGLALGTAAGVTGGIAYLVDGLWPFFEDRNRALHDIIVDSLVIKD